MKKLFVSISDSVYSDLENFVFHCNICIPGITKSFAVNMFLDRSLDFFRRGLSDDFTWNEMISSYFKSEQLRKFNNARES